MSIDARVRARLALMLLAAAMLAALRPVWAQTPGDAIDLPRDTVLYRTGEVLAYANGRLSVLTEADRTLNVTVGARTRIAILSPAAFADIADGTYLAAIGRPTGTGEIEAIEVRIVEERLRGIGEGHRPFHAIDGATMTNAKVVSLGGEQAPRAVYVRYRGKDKAIVVPEAAPVMRQAIGDPSALTPGTPVSLFTVRGSNGKTEVIRVNVGLGGIVPRY